MSFHMSLNFSEAQIPANTFFPAALRVERLTHSRRSTKDHYTLRDSPRVWGWELSPVSSRRLRTQEGEHSQEVGPRLPRLFTRRSRRMSSLREAAAANGL